MKPDARSHMRKLKNENFKMLHGGRLVREFMLAACLDVLNQLGVQ